MWASLVRIKENIDFFCRLIVLKNGIGYGTIVASLKNSSMPYSTVDSIQQAYDSLIENSDSVLMASSIEASYVSVMVR